MMSAREQDADARALWNRAFLLRNTLLLGLLATALVLPVAGPQRLAIACALAFVALPFNEGLRRATIRTGRVPAIMAVGDPVLAASLALVFPHLLGTAMVAAELQLAIAAVLLTRKRAFLGAAVGSLAFGVLPAAYMYLNITPAVAWVFDIPAYTGAAFTTALVVGSLAERERIGRRQLTDLVEGLGVVVYELDLDTLRFLFVSQHVEELSGMPAGRWVAEPDLMWRLTHPDDRLPLQEALAASGDTGAPLDITYRLVTGEGEKWVRNVCRIDTTDPAGGRRARGSIIDVTQQRAAESALVLQANTDDLTGLANRSLLVQRLTADLAGARLGRVALLFLDVDKFKRINDSLGHSAGDALLQAVAGRLSSRVRATDTVARLGGDEYVVLSRFGGDTDDEADSEVLMTQLATRLLSAFDEPYEVNGHWLSVTASLGAVLAEDDHDADSLMAAADVAMYEAKGRGGKRHVLFTADLQHRVVEQMTLELQLRNALSAGQFRLVYQPILSCEDKLVGVEALLRWCHPERGEVSPNDFIPAAELTGDIVAIGRWVLQQACLQHAAWARTTTEQSLRMSVNVSVRQLTDPHFVHDVTQALSDAGMRPDQLCLEVTETALLADPAGAKATLTAISRLGVRIALDDFGTGYSSLTHLRQFPVDLVKVDRSFVANIGEGPGQDYGIVASTISMAGHLGLEVTAEGVETSGQRSALEAMGCPLLQGFLIARPMPGEDLLAWDAARAAANIPDQRAVLF